MGPPGTKPISSSRRTLWVWCWPSLPAKSAPTSWWAPCNASAFPCGPPAAVGVGVNGDGGVRGWRPISTGNAMPWNPQEMPWNAMKSPVDAMKCHKCLEIPWNAMKWLVSHPPDAPTYFLQGWLIKIPKSSTKRGNLGDFLHVASWGSVVLLLPTWPLPRSRRAAGWTWHQAAERTCDFQGSNLV